MFKITHLASTVFNALHTAMRGFSPFGYGADCTVVETSRYTHATDPVSKTRVYMSKPSWANGLTVTTSPVRAGDEYIHLTLCEGRKVVAQVTCKVTDAKAVAATLSSACMKAQSRTGFKMAASEWQTANDTATVARAEAAYTASLFD